MVTTASPAIRGCAGSWSRAATRKFRKIESFSHSALGKDRSQKPIDSDERLRLALEIHLSVLAERLPVCSSDSS